MAAYFVAVTGCMVPGGGGSTQVVPDTIRAGAPATFRLEMSVNDIHWIWGRFRHLALHYRVVGQPVFQTIAPVRRMLMHRDQEAYEFTVPPLPSGTAGYLEYYFTFTFDGVPNRADGYKQVRIEPRTSARNAAAPEPSSNEALQLKSAGSSEGLRLSAYRDATASSLASRILSRPPAAELQR